MKYSEEDKLCVKVTKENRSVLSEFLYTHRHLYRNYKHTWDPVIGNYFYLNPSGLGGCQYENICDFSYTLVDIETFLRQMNYKMNNSNINNYEIF